MNHLRISLVSTLLLAGIAGTAQAALGNASQSSVVFDAVGPAGMKIQGTSSTLSVGEEGGNVKVTVPLANLTTGISLRDKHMREKYLEVDKYPNAVLTVARGALKMPSGGAITADADGTITIHGVSKPAHIHYTAKPDGNAFAVEGTTKVNMNDFGIQVPSYLGVTVKPDVAITVKFHATDA